MRLAHVHERNAPAGTAWRLAAALDPAATTWLDIEVARRRAVADRSEPRPRFRPAPHAGHDPRRPPRARAAGRGARRPRRGVRAAVATRTTQSSTPTTSSSVRRSCDPRRSATSTRSSGTSARCGAAARRSQRPGFGCRSSTSRNVSELRGPGDPVWAPRGSLELDYELEVGALIDTPVRDVSDGARRGGDRRLLRPQRLVGARPPARRDDGPARAGQGQGLRGLHRPVARDARRARGPSRPGLDRARPHHDGDRPDLRRAGRGDLARDDRVGPPCLRRDDRPRVRRRSASAGRPHRQRDGGWRLPARDPGRDPRAGTWSRATR